MQTNDASSVMLESLSKQQLIEALKQARLEMEQLRSTQEEKVQERTQQLELAKREWEQTFDAIEEPVLLLGKDYQIKRANLALARAVDKNIRSLIGQLCHKELMNRDTPCENCPLERTFSSNEGQQSEIHHKNGQTIYNVRSFPRSDHLNQVIHTYHDITEEKEFRELLVQSEKISNIGMLAAQVAHEVNNPLAGILAQAQLLLLDIEPDAPNDLYPTLKEIEKAALRCRTIILNLLNFSRQNPSQRKERLSINRIIEQTIPIYEMMPPRSAPQLTLELSGALPSLLLDTNKVQSILLNLLGNAKSATPRQGTITVRTYQEGTNVCLSVEDSGSGMSEELQAKVFTPFFTTKEKGLGTGLGLHIVQQIVEEHNGRITLESQKGIGTTFLISLPIE